MRLSDSAHLGRPWRIHALTPDFRLEDVWALPTPGDAHDFQRLVEAFVTDDPERSTPAPVRAVWSLRWALGRMLGWDEDCHGVGARVPSLAERLPEDLRAAPKPEFEALPFRSMYLLDDEFAAEIANETMHGVLHVGWVEDGAGAYHGQMAVLVKPNGWLGEAYMAAIRPFRHALVYPALLRQLERGWRPRVPA